jgi:hypothetical protein
MGRGWREDEEEDEEKTAGERIRGEKGSGS